MQSLTRWVSSKVNEGLHLLCKRLDRCIQASETQGFFYDFLNEEKEELTYMII